MDTQTLIIISLGLFIALILIGILFSQIGKKGLLKDAALLSTQKEEDGFIGVPTYTKSLLGKKGLVLSDLRPAGKVEINNKVYDAVSDREYINKDEYIIVDKVEIGQVYVIRDLDKK